MNSWLFHQGLSRPNSKVIAQPQVRWMWSQIYLQRHVVIWMATEVMLDELHRHDERHCARYRSIV
jgi:hypothetical protein